MGLTQVSRSAGRAVRRASRRGRRTARAALRLLLCALLVAAPLPPIALADDDDAPASELARPEVLAGDARLDANRATAWSDQGRSYTLLEGDVRIAVGTYGFRAERALVRITRERVAGGTISDMAVYLDEVRPMAGRGPVRAESPRLLVTFSTTGDVHLANNLLRTGAPDGDAFVVAGLQRFEAFDARLTVPLADVPEGEPLLTPEMAARREAQRERIESSRTASIELPAEPTQTPWTPTVTPTQPGDGQDTTAAAQPGETDGGQGQTTAEQPPQPRVPRAASLLPPGGQVSFSAERIVFQPGKEGEDESTLVLIGNISFVYQDHESQRNMSLSADNAVVFVKGGALADLAGQKLDAESVTGVYLEDDVVATDGQYTVRAPRVFYDLRANRAVVLDAEMYTWDANRQVPIYVRARQIRQEALGSWTAHDAQLTTSEFGEPHFAIASRMLTFTQAEGGDGRLVRSYTASDSTVRVGGVPIAYWPYLAGGAAEFPIKRLTVGYDDDGPTVRTTFDLFALLGREAPQGVTLDGHVDYLGDHGPAIGLDLDYDLEQMYGTLAAYLLINDTGEDEIGKRRDIEHDGDLRGFLQWQHRQSIRGGWELSIETAYVSDETFLDEFMRTEPEQAMKYETSRYLQQQQKDWALTVLAASDLNDFTTQTTTLQTPGYTVDKLPELGYYRVGTTLLDKLSYYSETRLSRMRIRGGDDSPKDRGFRPSQSMRAFGIPNTTDFEDALDAAGIPSQYRNRFDTRHEIQAPLKLDVFNVVPYAVGRVTAYDRDFSSFSGDDEQVRLWGMVGMRVHTEFSRTLETLDDRLLDLHRLRHVVEPSVDVFFAATNLDSEDLPVYDPDVESLAKGFGVAVGLRNTWQTQRGGPGRWRSVDWIVLNTQLILRSDDADVNTEIPRYFGYRPEYSQGGDHVYIDLMWAISDTLALAAETTYSIEDSNVPQWRLGISMQHTPRLTRLVDYLETDELGQRLLSYGFTYQLTTKYELGLQHLLDLVEGDTRDIEMTLTRRMSRWRLIMVARHDQVDDEQTIGVVLVPEGFGGGATNTGRGRFASDLLPE